MSPLVRFACIFIFCLVWMGVESNAQSDRNRDFDFWIGEWNVYKYGTDTLVGVSHIEAILGGNVIRESYSTTRGAFKGTSLNKYNTRNKRWEQYWVDNSGTTLHILGGLQNEKMVLKNVEKYKDDSIIHNRLTWQKMEGGEVRQTWDQSYNEGESWTSIFDGRYSPK